MLKPDFRVISLIDMDCFYAQVEAHKRNLSYDTPLVAVQWGLIIAVSYSARPFGIKRGVDSLASAMQKCPNLYIAHVDTMDDKGVSINLILFILYQEPDYHAAIQHRLNRKPCIICLLLYDLMLIIGLHSFREESFKIFSLLKKSLPNSIIERASIDEVYIDLSNDVEIILPYTILSSQQATPSNLLLSEEEIKEIRPDCWKGIINRAVFLRADQNRSDSDLYVLILLHKGIIEGDSSISSDNDINLLSDTDKKLLIGSHLIAKVRKTVYEQLGYTCSAGFHKPSGQTILKHNPISGRFFLNILLMFIVSSVLSYVPIEKLHGLGGKLGREIKNYGIKTPNDLFKRFKTVHSLSIALQSIENAEFVWNACQGIDNTPVKSRIGLEGFCSAKSLVSAGAGRNEFGVRTVEELTPQLLTCVHDITSRVTELQESVNKTPTKLSLSYGGDNGWHSHVMPISLLSNPESLFKASLAMIQKESKPFPLYFIALGVSKLMTVGENIGHYFKKVESLTEICEDIPTNDIIIDTFVPESETLTFERVKCPSCGEQIPADKVAEHRDYHYAIDLSNNIERASSFNLDKPIRASPIMKKKSKRKREIQSQIDHFFGKRVEIFK